MAVPGGAAIIRDPKPVFLKVLCILTFVGSGLAFFKNLFTLATYNVTKLSVQNFSAVNPLMPKSASPFFSIIKIPKIHTYLNWTLWGGFIGLAACLMTLTGALLMWRLRKSGFFIYIVAEALVFFSATMMMFASLGMKLFGLQSLIMSILVMVTTAGFIAMYTINLKYLK